ncbi:UNVERIFIED_CONTAM: hypothetical protein K2H54_047591 [Gekko kuhli]
MDDQIVGTQELTDFIKSPPYCASHTLSTDSLLLCSHHIFYSLGLPYFCGCILLSHYHFICWEGGRAVRGKTVSRLIESSVNEIFDGPYGLRMNLMSCASNPLPSYYKFPI